MSSACSFIFMQIKVIFIRMVSHVDSPWNRGTRELWNDLLACVCWFPALGTGWFGSGCMRVFSRLARFACFAALGTGLIFSVVWCWVHAHFLALYEGDMFSRPFTGVMLSCDVALGARVLCISSISHMWLHLFSLESKGFTLRLRAMISSGNLSYPKT